MDVPWPRPVRAKYFTSLPATAGAAFAVGIGYMDPGNWATDLDATRYGNTLLWSILCSGIAAAVLQILVVRFSTVTGSGLMESITRVFPKASYALWAVYVASIGATELAEFVGLIVGLQMVLGCSLPVAVVLGVSVLGGMLFAGGATTRRLEVLAIATTLGLALVYAFEIGWIRPAAGPILTGATVPYVASPGAMLAIVGIVGATIMPHNLFLHNGLIRDAVYGAPAAARARIAKRAVLSTIATLGGATLINAAIAVVGAATHATTIESAFRTLRPVAGSTAALLFGLALIAAALAASVSAVSAGDIICGPGAPVPLSRFRRRVLAMAPAAALLAIGVSPTALLLASQVALGIALPAVVIPLIMVLVRERVLKAPGDRALLGASVGVTLATCACNGLAITSLFLKS